MTLQILSDLITEHVINVSNDTLYVLYQARHDNDFLTPYVHGKWEGRLFLQRPAAVRLRLELRRGSSQWPLCAISLDRLSLWPHRGAVTWRIMGQHCPTGKSPVCCSLRLVIWCYIVQSYHIMTQCTSIRVVWLLRGEIGGFSMHTVNMWYDYLDILGYLA